MKVLKNNIVFILFLVFVATSCSNKQVPDTIEKNTSKTNIETVETTQNEKPKHIKSIELESPDYSDLEFLKHILKDKRVVMLGESSHGVSEYSLIKNRLIKFLHEELGYNVVAFESGLTEVNITNEMMLDFHTVLTAMKKSIYSVWHTKNNIDLYTYFKNQKSSNHPINIAGFDMRPMGSGDELLYQFFKDIDLEYAKDVEFAEKEFLRLTSKETVNLNRATWNKEAKKLINQYNDLLSGIEEQSSNLAKQLDFNEIKLLNKVFEQRIYLLSNVFNREEYYTNWRYGYNLRDVVMAENLVWLLEEMYPNEKFVVWAHNGHIMKKSSKVLTDSSGIPLVSFVENLPERIKEQSYIIGLYMYSGKRADVYREIFDVNMDHKKNSIEYRLNEPGYPVSFINIDITDNETNSYWWNSEVSSKSEGVYESSFIPSEQYDGLILIQQANPPNYR
ncbi:erythromycin esterase family protein [Bacillus solimangrovi]|uniref:Erythromycin esterase n=1 Tax=Bacillus solimangrovi TaxID=1305675 RepID=A0A1E5LJZ3_9BACI|nr:erythromycin esterase family protein [Bacillus solimangrovi]OEH94395.1 hypothetical protein BFG57_08000 [Bacillus solimangrovi]